MSWEAVIGLEVHAELNTESKMFCSCKNQFGGKANSRCCPVCTGMPGTLPKPNKKAIEYAVRAGVALGAQISHKTRLYRKNYFYPDLPKGYQISQFTVPLCMDGKFEYFCGEEAKNVRIRQVHIEEDAGKLIHNTENTTQIDYNRCGVPLIEIVTEPDLRSSVQAREFLESIRVMLLYLGISSCRMQEGALRCDVNVSVRKTGQEALSPRVEMKNINTFAGAERAIEYEIKRQIQLLEGGERISQETRRWDDEQGKSTLLRTKENAADYRYFPEPDVPCIIIDQATVAKAKTLIPELEFEKIKRYCNEFNLPMQKARQIARDSQLAKLFDRCIELSADPVICSNLILGEVLSAINRTGNELEESGITCENLTGIAELYKLGEISITGAKKAVAYLFENGGESENALDVLDIRQISDGEYIQKIIEETLEENPKAITDLLSGKKNVMGFLTGQCMRKSRGKANPVVLSNALEEMMERLLEQSENI